MKKKMLSLIMALAMVASLSGCGNGNSNNNESGSVSQPEATSGTANAEASSEAPSSEDGSNSNDSDIDISEEVVLKIYGVGGEGGTHSQEILDAVNEITKREINATIDLNMISWGDYTQKLPAIMASGEDYDLIYTSSWCFFKTEGPKGAFLELTPDMLSTYMPFTYAEYPEVAWEQGSLNGKIYLVPTVINEYESHGFLIRGDLREKYGVKEIETIEDLEAYFQAIKDNEQGMVPFKGTSTENINTAFSYFQNDYVVSGGVIRSGMLADHDDVSTINAALNFDFSKDAIDRVRSWYEKGYIANDILANQTTSSELFKTGQSAMCTTNVSNATSLRKEILAANPDWVLEYVDFEGDNMVQRNAYNGNGMAVGRNSKNPERALMFLELVYQNQDLYDLLRYGLEDATYQLDDQGRVSTPEVANTAEIEISNIWMGIRIQKFERSEADAWDVIEAKNEEFANKAYDNPLVTVTYDLESVNAEIAAVNNIYDQYEMPLKWGVVDPEDPENGLDALMKRYQDAGLDKIVETVKTQVAEQLGGN